MACQKKNDWYHVLQIARDATQADIDRQYRKLYRRYGGNVSPYAPRSNTYGGPFTKHANQTVFRQEKDDMDLT